MKRLLITLSLFISLLVPFSAGSALAVDISTGCGQGSVAGTPVVCPQIKPPSASSKPILDLIKTVINILSIAVGIAAVIVIIVEALSMVLSGGDAQAAAHARTGIIYALVGIAVVIFSQAIVVFVLNHIS